MVCMSFFMCVFLFVCISFLHVCMYVCMCVSRFCSFMYSLYILSDAWILCSSIHECWWWFFFFGLIFSKIRYGTQKFFWKTIFSVPIECKHEWIIIYFFEKFDGRYFQSHRLKQYVGAIDDSTVPIGWCSSQSRNAKYYRGRSHNPIRLRTTTFSKPLQYRIANVKLSVKSKISYFADVYKNESIAKSIGYRKNKGRQTFNFFFDRK